MSYTPHTWTDGETITAAKMNNLEEGCGSGGGNPIMTINTVSFSSGSHYIGSIALCKFENDIYYAQPLLMHGEAVMDYSRVQIVITEMGSGTFYYPLEIPVPSGDLFLVLIEDYGYTYTFSGNIDAESVSVDHGTISDGHIITGDFTVTVA